MSRQPPKVFTSVASVRSGRTPFFHRFVGGALGEFFEGAAEEVAALGQEQPLGPLEHPAVRSNSRAC